MIQIFGKVIHGEHFGKRLGFPTANLERRSFSRRRMKVRLGVYAGIAQVSPPPNLPHQGGGNRKFPSLEGRGKGRVYKAAIVIGPLGNRRLPKIEAHLIGFKGNLYGKYLSIGLNIYLRSFRQFSSTEELKQQITIDVNKIKRLK